MVSIIAAFTKNRVVGKDGALPWHLSEDMKLFKELTINQTVIMGRKTYDSLPAKFKPLPQRHNIVVSRSLKSTSIAGVEVCPSVEAAIEKGKRYGKEIFIIGGASIYAQALPYTTKMYLSHLKKEYEGDTYFPEFDVREWEIIETKEFADFILKVYWRE